MSSLHDVFTTENRARGFPGILKGSEELEKIEKTRQNRKKSEKNAEKSVLHLDAPKTCIAAVFRPCFVQVLLQAFPRAPAFYHLCTNHSVSEMHVF